VISSVTPKLRPAARPIEVPLDVVFQTISDVRNFSKAVTHIVKIEVLSEQHCGVGTRFCETRLMNGREQTVELEVAEYGGNDRVRMVSDAGGTIWDTVFTVAEDSDMVLLSMVMEARPHKLMARLTMPMIMGVVGRAVEKDMDAVVEYCKRQAAE